MKNILIILITISSFSCKAQQPIIALDSLGFDIPNGAYLKDISHDLDKFVGTWVMQSPFSKLTIKIRKIDQYNNDTFFEDILVGEYKYELNGNTVVNTLPSFSDLSMDPYDHYIVGSQIIYAGQSPSCADCGNLEKRMDLSFTDPDELNRGHLNRAGRIILRYKNENSVEKMEIKIFLRGPILSPENAPLNFQLPTGNYVLIKQ